MRVDTCQWRHAIGVTIDRKQYAIESAAKKLGIPDNTLRYYCYKKYTDQPTMTKWVSDSLWKIKYGVALKQEVFTHKGNRMCVERLQQIIGGSRNTSQLRIRQWLSGTKTFKEIIRPIKLYKPRVVQARHYTSTSAPCEGLQPRKDVSELGCAGSWEKEHCTSETFSKSCSSHRVAKTSNGTHHLRGD